MQKEHDGERRLLEGDIQEKKKNPTVINLVTCYLL